MCKCEQVKFILAMKEIREINKMESLKNKNKSCFVVASQTMDNSIGRNLRG